MSEHTRDSAPAVSALQSPRALSRECMVDAHELCRGTAETGATNHSHGQRSATTPCGCTECGHEGAR